MASRLGKTAWAYGLGCALACGAANVARAEPGPAAHELGETVTLGSDVELAARTAFEAGLEAAKAEDFARARSLFVRSRELVPKPSTLLNLALMDLQLGLSDEAMSVLDELLRVAKGPDYERMRERAERLRVDAHALHDAQVGSALGPLDRVTAPAPEPPAAALPEPPRAPSAPEPQPAAPPPALLPPPSFAAPRALVGSGVVLALASIATGVGWWRNRNQAYDRCYRPDGAVCDERDQIEAQRTGAMIATLGLDVAAVGLAVGGGVWLARLRRGPEARSLSISVQGAGLALRAAF